MAFPTYIRRIMFKRDKAMCCNCLRRWDDGWMLQAAHYENGQGKPKGNTVDDGRMLCIKCHCEEHEHCLSDAKKANNKQEIKRHKFAVGKLTATNQKRRGY